MKLQRLLSLTRQAVDDYALIDSGDKIAVGISGGKDSLTLLYALHGLKRFYPNEFELSAITVDLGFENFDLSPVRSLCSELSVPFIAKGVNLVCKFGQILVGAALVVENHLHQPFSGGYQTGKDAACFLSRGRRHLLLHRNSLGNSDPCSLG